MTEPQPPSESPGAPRGSHLRLVWSNPAPRPLPKRPLDLAAAIERQVLGEYGLNDEDFARVFARAACFGDASPRPVPLV